MASIPYAIAQQSVGVPALVPEAPVALVPTDHPPLSKDVSQYWFVPPVSRAGSRQAGLPGNFARGVKAIEAGDYAAGLALLGRADLDETPLSNYAKYYQAVALHGLSRMPEADTVLTALVNTEPAGYLSEAAALKLAEVLLARPDPARAENLLRGMTSGAKGGSEDVWMLLGRAEEALESSLTLPSGRIGRCITGFRWEAGPPRRRWRSIACARR